MGNTKKALCISILAAGTTSRSQAEWLRRITPDIDWDWFDTDKIFQKESRLSRSLAFRFRMGTAVERINHEIKKLAKSGKWDLIWIGKGTLLKPETIQSLRERTDRLIHYTPDTAFYANRSILFNKSLQYYDMLITTKSFELPEYYKRVDPQRIFLTTQGYDPDIHYSDTSTKKSDSVVFIGLAEPDRIKCLETLLSNKISVQLGGKGWTRFVAKYKKHPNFSFLGSAVFGNTYSDAIRNSGIGLGLLSKKFPELHTTRTFEIPACGTVLATPITVETERFFEPNEAIFFKSFDSLADNIQEMFNNRQRQSEIARLGHLRVTNGCFSYPCILTGCLERVGITVQDYSTKTNLL